MTTPGPTPSQTVGPFFSILFLRQEPVQVLVRPETEGQRIRIEGRILDGDGAPVDDALIEIWQANSYGRYNHPADRGEAPLDAAFTGFGRAGTDEAGRYWFETIKPGRVPFDAQTWQAPHVVFTVLARGLLNHLATRLYFAVEAANDANPVLQRVPAERRATLLAQPESVAGKLVYRFDIILQGEAETVFFRR